MVSPQFMALYPQWVVVVALKMRLQVGQRGVQAVLVVAAAMEQQAGQALLVKATLVALAHSATQIIAAVAAEAKMLLVLMHLRQSVAMAEQGWRGLMAQHTAVVVAARLGKAVPQKELVALAAVVMEALGQAIQALRLKVVPQGLLTQVVVAAVDTQEVLASSSFVILALKEVQVAL
jgi:hypothetical protein